SLPISPIDLSHPLLTQTEWGFWAAPATRGALAAPAAQEHSGTIACSTVQYNDSTLGHSATGETRAAIRLVVGNQVSTDSLVSIDFFNKLRYSHIMAKSMLFTKFCPYRFEITVYYFSVTLKNKADTELTFVQFHFISFGFRMRLELIRLLPTRSRS
ncbi:MAG: hypothetical protein ABJZ69_04945, partial [Hyphomicrobiales bacterium]